MSLLPRCVIGCVFFFNDTATTEIYTLSLHDALPISRSPTRCAGAASRCSTCASCSRRRSRFRPRARRRSTPPCVPPRSEEHTSELQSRQYLVCRLLLEKKKIKTHDEQIGQYEPHGT